MEKHEKEMGKLYYPFKENRKELEEIAKEIRDSGRRIVLAGGTFDAGQAHLIHIEFLRACKELGDILFVNVTNHDRAVLRKKDKSSLLVPRPYYTEHVRALYVSAIDAVDHATVYPYVGNPDNPEDVGPTTRLAAIIKPNVIVKGIQEDGKGWGNQELIKIKRYLRYDPDLKEIHIEGDIDSTSLLEYQARTEEGLQEIGLFEDKRYLPQTV
ncbi:MAG: hypothetical protein KJ905_02750 [Nanoarchaeota archaeon]|nr:hypothetical protein [Nanoarchaeota archaeon]